MKIPVFTIKPQKLKNAANISSLVAGLTGRETNLLIDSTGTDNVPTPQLLIRKVKPDSFQSSETAFIIWVPIDPYPFGPVPTPIPYPYPCPYLTQTISGGGPKSPSKKARQS